jgi:hypothetical protein
MTDLLHDPHDVEVVREQRDRHIGSSQRVRRRVRKRGKPPRSRPGHPMARREYEAHGIPFVAQRDAIDNVAEACVVIRRLWTEDEPFDYEGS